MLLAVTVASTLALPQLAVAPYPARVGEPLVVHAGPANAPIAALAVGVRLPDGGLRPAGVTDATGELAFAPSVAGYHVFEASVGGVRSLAPVAVLPARARWPLALGAVPLGLALAWAHVRALRARRPQQQPAG